MPAEGMDEKLAYLETTIARLRENLSVVEKLAVTVPLEKSHAEPLESSIAALEDCRHQLSLRRLAAAAPISPLAAGPIRPSSIDPGIFERLEKLKGTISGVRDAQERSEARLAVLRNTIEDAQAAKATTRAIAASPVTDEQIKQAVSSIVHEWFSTQTEQLLSKISEEHSSSHERLLGKVLEAKRDILQRAKEMRYHKIMEEIDEQIAKFKDENFSLSK
ncbi:hypothetical protein CPC08DRAFT_745748 [Agrocybe pediades]|nr:hypothetical protein CPC08DRAFT_745748 [Agrocybe pediades]